MRKVSFVRLPSSCLPSLPAQEKLYMGFAEKRITLPTMQNVTSHLSGRYVSILLYAGIMAMALFVLHWLELRLLVVRHSFEVYAGLLALVFTLLGIWLALKLARPKVETRLVEREVFVKSPETFEPNQAEIERLGLSKRELDVLGLMAEGLSNEEIGIRLFVSPNTVKTHGARLFEKLEVNRRIQAVEKARRLFILG